MIIKNIDLSDRTVWGINHKIRNTNPFTLFDLQKIVKYYQDKDGLRYQIQTVLNQVNGFYVWQIKEL